MIRRLASWWLTLGSLGFLVLWLMVGMVLAVVPPYAKALAGLNEVLVWDWLFTQAPQEPGLTAWLAVLCLAVTLLMVNLLACTVTLLTARWRAGQRWAAALLLAMHLLLASILAGHFSGMFLGFKQEDARLAPGATYQLPDGGVLKVEEVVFVDDPAILNLPYRQARRVQTRQNFHRADDVVRVSLARKGRPPAQAMLRIMEPWQIGGLRVALQTFYRLEGAGPPRVGAVLNLVVNPLTRVFLVSYALWITAYFLWLIRLGRANGRSNGRNNGRSNGRQEV
ncbi:MAG: hypothetical protein KQJ78_13010 [Deltaproteobacteria bacterium]|nr:hypothetical protein [Deltaproteobacteria bacterium]